MEWNAELIGHLRQLGVHLGKWIGCQLMQFWQVDHHQLDAFFTAISRELRNRRLGL